MIDKLPWVWALGGGPILVIAAIWLFLRLLARARLKKSNFFIAALLYLCTLTFPVLHLVIFWLLNWACGGPDNVGEAGLGLLAIAGALLGVMGAMNLSFWIALLVVKIAAPPKRK